MFVWNRHRRIVLVKTRSVVDATNDSPRRAKLSDWSFFRDGLTRGCHRRTLPSLSDSGYEMPCFILNSTARTHTHTHGATSRTANDAQRNSIALRRCQSPQRGLEARHVVAAAWRSVWSRRRLISRSSNGWTCRSASRQRRQRSGNLVPRRRRRRWYRRQQWAKKRGARIVTERSATCY